MKLLKESMSVEDQERLILYANNNAKVKNKVLDILKTEYELREDDLYDCEYAIDNASWEKEHKHEFSYWNLDTIIRDHLIDTIIEVKHNLSKHKSLSEYKNFVAKWTAANPSYDYSDLADKMHKRFGSNDLRYFIQSVMEKIDIDKIYQDGQKLIELAQYLRDFKGE